MNSNVFPKVRLARPKKRDFGRIPPIALTRPKKRVSDHIPQSTSGEAQKARFRSFSLKCVWGGSKSVISVIFPEVRLARPKKRDFARICQSTSCEVKNSEFGRIPKSASGENQKA